MLSTPPAKRVAHTLTRSGAITGSYRQGSCFPAGSSLFLLSGRIELLASVPTIGGRVLALAGWTLLSWRRRRSECISLAPSVCASTRSASLLLMDMNIYPVRAEISTAEANQQPVASTDTSRWSGLCHTSALVRGCAPRHSQRPATLARSSSRNNNALHGVRISHPFNLNHQSWTCSIFTLFCK